MTKLLVLDDDPTFLIYLCDQLERRGFQCIATQSGVEAMRIGRSAEIRFALVDEILFEPGSIHSELQRYQGRAITGRDVVQQIRAVNPGMHFFFISSFPERQLQRYLANRRLEAQDVRNPIQEAATFSAILTRAQASLARLPGVLDFINKSEVTQNTEATLSWLETNIRQALSEPQPPAPHGFQRSLLIAVVVPPDAFSLILRRAVLRAATSVTLADEYVLVRDAFDSSEVSTQEIHRMATRTEEVAMLELPSRTILPCHGLRSSAQYFRILVELAKRDYLGQNAVIDRRDYEALQRGEKPVHPDSRQHTLRARSSDGLAHSEVGKLFNEAVDAGLRVVERSSNRALSKQINELRKHLASEGVAIRPSDSRGLFVCRDGQYRPTFPIRLAAISEPVWKRYFKA